nr:hypothetical protein [Tanacetum cinerariifolium]
MAACNSSMVLSLVVLMAGLIVPEARSTPLFAGDVLIEAGAVLISTGKLLLLELTKLPENECVSLVIMETSVPYRVMLEDEKGDGEGEGGHGRRYHPREIGWRDMVNENSWVGDADADGGDVAAMDDG